MQAAINSGITAFDTAFSYGLSGESDRLIARHLSSDRHRYTITAKVGQRYEDGRRVVRGDADTLRRDAETSLHRCNLDRFDTLLLHDIDPAVPIATSAAAMAKICDDGMADRIGICNATIEQIDSFADHCPVAVTQCGFNLLQPTAQQQFIPDCVARQIEVDVFWTLMKGLLAGRIRRGHRFTPGDSRSNYDIFQGDSFEQAQQTLDRLDRLATTPHQTVAQLAIGWALSQPGVHTAIVGARHPEQIPEVAATTRLPNNLLHQVTATTNPTTTNSPTKSAATR